jgi:predicted ATPase/class 3 adenylate cyclase
MRRLASDVDRSGLVTLLFTDIEGSTRLWEDAPDEMRVVLARHDAIVREAVETRRGRIVKTVGDGAHAIFDDPRDGLDAAVAAQLAIESWPAEERRGLHIRCGLHTGMVEHRDRDVYGIAVNRAARITAAAHGGQVLCSRAVATLVADRLPREVTLRDLGAVWLRGVAAPEQILQVLHPRLRDGFPPLRSLRANPNNLPQPLTSFVGRELELASVRRLLGGVRVLTLTGPGGIGKTRLALQVAASVVDEYLDGVWYVDLAAVSDPALVPHALASVWSLHEEAGTPLVETLCRHAQSRRALLVLDNCEHLLAACAQLVASLAHAAATLTVLATSHESLRIYGEQVYPLPPLSLPLARTDVDGLLRADAARLFLERAQMQLASFAPSAANAGVIASICARLDGIPLALELAAARVGTLPIEAIAARLDNRFALLTRGERTALPRQQTLGALLDWSHDLLDADEKALFARLAVFAGGFDLDAAEAVCPDGAIARQGVVDLVDRLVQKSLVTPDGPHDRFRMLETIQEYAAVRLRERGEDDALRERHAAFYLAFAESAEPAWLTRTDEAAWLARLARDHANLKRALQLMQEEPPPSDRALRLCGALGHYWRMRGHWREGRDACNTAIARDTAGAAPPSVRAKALLACGMMNARLGELTAAQSLVEASLALAREAGNQVLEAGALNNLSLIVSDRGNFALAHELVRNAASINEARGNQAWQAINLANQGHYYIQQELFDEAREPLERARALARATKTRSLEALSLSRMGMLAERLGEWDDARASATAALAIYREIEAPLQQVNQLQILASVAAACGNTAEAARYLGEDLETSRDLGYRASIVEGLDAVARLAAASGDHVQAGRFLGAAAALREAVGMRATARESEQQALVEATCERALGDQRWRACVAEGRAASSTVVDEALGWLARLGAGATRI